MSVVIDFGGSKGAGVECNRVNFARIILNGENGAKSVIRSICLDNDRAVRNPMSEDRSGGKSPLKGLKSLFGLVSEYPFDTFSCETSKRSDYFGVVGMNLL
jgi:hypothetical protein